MAEVRFQDVSKRYGPVSVIEDLNLQVQDREFMVLVGPSGCGKSTALRMIAGLEDISSGSIEIGGRVVNDLPPKNRDIAMVFQSYALYPHMTVRENLEFGLRIRKMPRSEMDALVTDAARILGLEQLLDRKPKELSGGQRQRVAVGRAIVRQPAVFLFDEPLSNLDAKLRVQMRAEITKLQQRLQTTCVYVTHDQIEAMTMGHRIAVMNAGRIQQVGTPLEVYERPANLFVAKFIGTPPMNVLRARITDGRLRANGIDLPLPQRKGLSGAEVYVGIRPEHLRDEPGGTARVQGIVEMVEPLGHEVIVHSRIGDELMVAALHAQRIPRVGEPIDLQVEIDKVHLFDADTEQRLPV
jgi:multiple sugar transport system ATP-binding protein